MFSDFEARHKIIKIKGMRIYKIVRILITPSLIITI